MTLRPATSLAKRLASAGNDERDYRDDFSAPGNRIRHETFFSLMYILVVTTTDHLATPGPHVRYRRPSSGWGRRQGTNARTYGEALMIERFFPEPQESDSIGRKREKERER